MYELIKANQLDLMLILCGACGILVLLLINTRFLSRRRKAVLILMEVMAVLLLWSDRLTYIYTGDTSHTGYIMVRLSNFLVFFLTSGMVLGFNMYLADLLNIEGGLEVMPKRLHLTRVLALTGMALAVISAFTDLYYYFDEANRYHRGNGFLIAYIIPLLGPILQYTVIRQYRKIFSRLIYISLILFIFVPILCGILQIFFYGISIVNISMAAVSIALYILMYLDLNNAIEHAHQIEIQSMQGEQTRMRRLFDQTATAFVSAVEKKDDFTKGNAIRIAEYARKIAEHAGKSSEDCEKAYYTALLHDVGLIGVPDSVIKNDADPSKEDYEIMRKKPEIGAEILSSITEYPYLSQGAHYSHERYNGTGYPDGLKGEEIPDIARLVGVADAYITMITKKRYRAAHPSFEAREAFVKGAGEEFDPVYADIMVKIIDSESGEITQESREPEDEIVCTTYRENTSAGISVESDVVKIGFDCDRLPDAENGFSAPALVLFDSYDGRVHDNKRAIENYHYLEYGEVWFDRHSITTAARKTEEKITEEREDDGKSREGGHYEIIAGRYEDHIRLVMRSELCDKEVTVALPGSSNAAYIGITGENCRISNIQKTPVGQTVGPGDIPRIVDPVSYIDHLESDVPNVQVDRTRSAYTEGILIGDRLKIAFHTMSLPGASLVWHCPYIVIYSSDDGRVQGGNYREYALIKLNGENYVTDEFATNSFKMKKKEGFSGWDAWKEANRRGMECEIFIEKSRNKILLKTENLGISIENTTTIRTEVPQIYAAITGDQVALTDIRLKY